MSRHVPGAFLLLLVLLLGDAVDPVHGQSTGEAMRIGPLELAPAVRLSDLGLDSNVFNESEHPTRDVTATVSPSIEASLQMSRARVRAHTEGDWVYFRDLTHLRSFDATTSARVDVSLNRVTPYASASVARTRHRQTLEVDARVRRRDESITAGADVQLSPRVSVGLNVRRSQLKYEDRGETDADRDLARLLNYSGLGQGLTFRYALTPLTSVVVEAHRHQDRFASAPWRDSNGTQIMPAIEFHPLALVSGRAAVGFRRRQQLNGELPEFRGTVARVDLRYTLLGRTRLGIDVERDLEYSYRVDRPQYVLSSLRFSATHRIHHAWEVGVRAGRSVLSYRHRADIQAREEETVETVGVDVGYSFGKSRLGLHLRRTHRDSDVMQSRQYRRVRLGTSLTYAF